jgi:hypothetical protein
MNPSRRLHDVRRSLWVDNITGGLPSVECRTGVGPDGPHRFQPRRDARGELKLLRGDDR